MTTATTGPFYIIEVENVGPNQLDDRNADADCLGIFTEPARANGRGEIQLEGWCGSSGDWATTAHGRFATLEEARAAIVAIIGDDFRECDPEGEAVETFRRGVYEIASTNCVEGVLADADIDAESTDHHISQEAKRLEETLNECGLTANRTLGLAAELRKMRGELREQAASDAAIEAETEAEWSARP